MRVFPYIFTLGIICTFALATEKPIYKRSFSEIMASYLFVNDFAVKQETRVNSEELFWKYPIKIPKISFPVHFDLDDPKKELPATDGVGREYEHINRGRALYFEGNFDEAKKVWLSARQTYGKHFEHHRRLDYLIGLSFLQLGKLHASKEADGIHASLAKNDLANAATFFSSAYIVKKDLADPLLDEVAPKVFYNLASIYFAYNRFAASYGAADAGLDYLRKTGRKDYRPQLRRFVIEGQIQNFTYLDAMKEIDVSIRQDPDPEQVSLLFRRAGDIYFSLNNYELAEENYAISSRINAEVAGISPAQHVIRGEALFWLGRFEEALRGLQFSLDSIGNKAITDALPPEFAAYAQLRIADIYLATKKNDDARLAYMRTMNEFRKHEVHSIAQVRSACLELPEYDGNNIKHARTLLDAAKTDDKLPNEALELAWACETASHSQRDRTDDMVERVRAFAYKYPQSRFLSSMLEPVKEVKASKINEYFEKGNYFGAISFFEQTRKLLYPEVSESLGGSLFRAYIDANYADKAAEFWPAFKKSQSGDLDRLRSLAFANELSDPTSAKKYRKEVSALARHDHKWNLEMTPFNMSYIQRIQHGGKNAGDHLGWIYEVYTKWAGSDPKLICNLVYPVMSDIAEQKSGAKFAVNLQKDLDSHISKMFPALLSSDETCAISLLEFEYSLSKKNPQELASRYLARTSWPLNKTLLGIFWDVSELNAQRGKKESAKDLWIFIKNNAPKESAEQTLATLRLDQIRTEYDKAWK